MADIVIDGNVKVTWLTTLASTTSPSAAALAAGVHLESFITPDGLAIEHADADVDVSGLNSTFTANRAGRVSVSVELTLKDQGRGNAPWTTFQDRPAGFLVVRRNVAATTAYAAAQVVSVYPVKAADTNPVAVAENEVAKFTVALMPTSAPSLSVAAAA